jgi:hypothetical protein
MEVSESHVYLSKFKGRLNEKLHIFNKRRIDNFKDSGVDLDKKRGDFYNNKMPNYRQIKRINHHLRRINHKRAKDNNFQKKSHKLRSKPKD